jgi:hypothetical protein
VAFFLLWDDSVVDVSNMQISEFCLSANVHPLNSGDGGDFKITAVYGPTTSNRKDDFFAELIAHKPPTLFASKQRKQQTISSSIVASLGGFGNF